MRRRVLALEAAAQQHRRQSYVVRVPTGLQDRAAWLAAQGIEAGRRIMLAPEPVPSAAAWLLAYGRGEVRAFESLYGRHRGTLYRFLMRQLGDRAAADEIFQEVWSRVIAVRERYRPEAKFTTWLLQIAHNLVVDLHRRQRPQVGAAEAEALFRNLDAPEEQRPERVLGEFEQRRRLQRALEDMPAEQREAFVMRMEWGLGLEDIAAVTGAGHETVKSRLRYALAKIRQRFSE